MMNPQLLLMADVGQFERDDSGENELAEEIWSDLIDEMTLGLCFDVHRSVKLGLMIMDDMTEEAQQEYEIVDEPGLDVFGQPPLKKHLECLCPSCNRNLAANRFAPHLEKCMGMGRNSSRLASKRIAIANTTKLDSDEDDDRDLDWTMAVKGSKRSRKEKLGNNSPRRTKSKLKPDVSDVSNVSSTNMENSMATFKALGNSVPVFETLTLEERKNILMTTCGVISEHTKKMCTKSLRCPQHTDEMRQGVRRYLLGLETEERLRHKADGVLETEEIDIDTYEDGDSQALRERLNRIQQWDAISNPSPAESTSTTNSNEGQGSKKRKKGGKLTHRKNRKQRPPSAQSQTSSGSTSAAAAALQYEVID
ncbi:ataxin-7-like protein 3 [Lytechinus variegatus]|uniref:ataxin-7-like protein 3 n=1 Tax=Lytechinus variegatus TaxID=7654 RepID=UPI001BB213E2|nr:ataxin-7-like protein 3 [Lytechinus variegatus]XP_041459191.1 ataxin-7-like protein 3 [Lytechinus variegatus]